MYCNTNSKHRKKIDEKVTPQFFFQFVSQLGGFAAGFWAPGKGLQGT
jgi:hypothetical protein